MTEQFDPRGPGRVRTPLKGGQPTLPQPFFASWAPETDSIERSSEASAESSDRGASIRGAAAESGAKQLRKGSRDLLTSNQPSSAKEADRSISSGWSIENAEESIAVIEGVEEVEDENQGVEMSGIKNTKGKAKLSVDVEKNKSDGRSNSTQLASLESPFFTPNTAFPPLSFALPSSSTRKPSLVPSSDLKPLFTDDSMRTKGISLIYRALKGESTEAVDEEGWRLAEKIENEIYLHSESHGLSAAAAAAENPLGASSLPASYKPSIRSHTSNLKLPGNARLRTALLEGSLSPAEFARMDEKAMQPPEQRNEETAVRRAGIWHSLNKDLVDLHVEGRIAGGDLGGEAVKKALEEMVPMTVAEMRMKKEAEEREREKERMAKAAAAPKVEVKQVKKRRQSLKRKHEPEDGKKASDSKDEPAIVLSSEEEEVERSGRNTRASSLRQQEETKASGKRGSSSTLTAGRRPSSSEIEPEKSVAVSKKKVVKDAGDRGKGIMSKLKSAVKRDESSNESSTGYVTDDEEEGGEYEVETIMDKKDKVLNGKPVTHYFVKWVNNEKPIWEPASNLSNCDAAIAEFERQRREDRTPQEVEQPKKRAKKRNESDESGAGRKREERMEEEMVVEIKKKGDFDPVMAGNESDSSDAKTVPIRRSPSIPWPERADFEMNEAVPETPEPLPSIGPTATLSTSEVIDEAVHAAEISNGEFMSAPGGSGYLGNQGKIPLSGVLSGWDEDRVMDL